MWKSEANSSLCAIKTSPFSVTSSLARPLGGNGEVAEFSASAVRAGSQILSSDGAALGSICGKSLALVGAAPLERRRAVVWTEEESGVWRAEAIRDFDGEIRAITLTSGALVVLTEASVHAFARKNYEGLFVSKAGQGQGSLSLLAVAGDCGNDQSSALVAAYPSPEKEGDVMVEGLESRRISVNAHDSRLAALALGGQGTLLATASEKGTVIRVFDAITGSFLAVFRRGSSPATISSLAFSPIRARSTGVGGARGEGKSSYFLAVTSTSQTVHLFQVEAVPKRQKSAAEERDAGRWRWVDYMEAESSAHQLRLSDPKSIAYFSPAGDLLLTTSEGVFYRYTTCAGKLSLAQVQAII